MTLVDNAREVFLPHAPRHGRTDQWLLLRVARASLLALSLATTLAIYAINAGGYPEYTNDDEGTYYAQAWAVVHRQVMAHYTYWYDHPMLGWVQMAPFLKPLTWLTGDAPVVDGGRLLMAAVATMSAYLLYRLARNIGVNEWVAIAVIPVWCLSPLTISLGREVFLDNISLMWLLAAFVWATGRPRLASHILSGAAYGVAVLSKETALLAAPGLLLALWRNAWRPTRSFSLVGWMGSTGLIVLGYLLYAGVKDEILAGPGHVSLASAIDWQLHIRDGAGFILARGTEAHATLQAWLNADWRLLVLGLALTPAGLFLKTVRPIAVVTVVYTLMALRPGGYLPAMLVATPLPFMALTVVAIVWWGYSAARRTAPRMRRGLRLLVVSVVTLTLAQVGQPWWQGIEYATTADDNSAYREGIAYVRTHLPRNSVVLTDDISWNDFVQMGWSGDGWHGPVWYFKLDRDPAAHRALPHGWRDVNYIFAARPLLVQLRTSTFTQASPQMVSARNNSELIARWGAPGHEVELLKVLPDGGRPGCGTWNCSSQPVAWKVNET